MCARCMMVAVGFLLLGCTPPSMTRRQLEAKKESYRRLRFNSATTVVVVMHRSVDEAVPSVWTGVVELGGPVESLRGDTLIIQPYYILKTQPTSSGDTQIVRINNARVLPDLVFIPAGPGFRVDSPSDTRRRGPSVGPILFIAGMLLYMRFYRW